MNIKNVIKALTSEAGIAGEEKKAELVALSYLKKYAPDATIKQCGVVGTIGKIEKGKKHVLLDAHIDRIGFIVSYITDDGFIKVGNIGGIDRRIVAAQQVTIHGKKDIAGVITSVPPHLASDSKSVPEISDILIDTGFTKEELTENVSLGDKISFKSDFEELLNDKVTSGALDDRCGIAAILYALDLLKDEKLNCTVTTVFSVQEEVGERGAKLSGFEFQPDIALAVDVSFANAIGENEEKCGNFGDGCMIGIAANLDRDLFEEMKEVAKKKEIPYQIEVMSNNTGTNADQYTVAGSGARSLTLSIPLRYMHTPVEVIDINDVKNTGKLIAEYIRRVK